VGLLTPLGCWALLESQLLLPVALTVNAGALGVASAATLDMQQSIRSSLDRRAPCSSPTEPLDLHQDLTALLCLCAACCCCPQAGGKVLDAPAVEITYGLERILMSLQGVKHFKDIRWAGGG
jgi:hypothetical protein